MALMHDVVGRSMHRGSSVICQHFWHLAYFNRRLRMRAIALTYTHGRRLFAVVLEYYSYSFANDTGFGLVCLFVWPFATLPIAACGV
jgi:hypothetical protein